MWFLDGQTGLDCNGNQCCYAISALCTDKPDEVRFIFGDELADRPLNALAESDGALFGYGAFGIQKHLAQFGYRPNAPFFDLAPINVFIQQLPMPESVYTAAERYGLPIPEILLDDVKIANLVSKTCPFPKFDFECLKPAMTLRLNLIRQLYEAMYDYLPAHSARRTREIVRRRQQYAKEMV